jgi:hypothetical protein
MVGTTKRSTAGLAIMWGVNPGGSYDGGDYEAWPRRFTSADGRLRLRVDNEPVTVFGEALQTLILIAKQLLSCEAS